jgi:type I restriction enzyme R subunit
MTEYVSTNEAETRADLIDPALTAAGWGKVEGSRIRREYPITKGRLLGHGQRGPTLSADYVLFYKNKMLAVIEAKKSSLSESEGVAQAKEYADRLNVRYTYATNGEGVYGIDMKTGKEGPEDNLPTFPTPDELWQRTYPAKSSWRDRFAAVPFEDKGGTWELRYYQNNAVENTLAAIASGKDRILLNLATGTGKTAIAFQLAWKLFESKWNISGEPTRRPRILFLADRNILADQAFNSFSAFPEDALVRIAPKSIKKKGGVPKNGSIFFTIFQTFMSGPDDTPYFGDYPEDFFDFIVIDECHRGGAKDESSWREILEYFSPAVQLGLTATPKRKTNSDTYEYFGRPVYTYSLKEGINDGFLTPFKVRQIATTMDDYVYTSDDKVVKGEVEEGKLYKESDFNTKSGLTIPERELKRVKVFMSEMHQNEKTIVFCAGQPHAALIRDLINQVKEGTDHNYCVRVTADDGALGEEYLRQFQDNDKTIPTVLTTSTKLSTGVDARNVRNIVLLRPVNNMIEFKQIIGRGTRLFDDKDYFTVYDFVKAYENFEDPEWDGEPADPVEGPKRQLVVEGSNDADNYIVDDSIQPKGPTIIKLADGKERQIQHMAATTFWGPDGKPVSATQFIEKLYGAIPDLFKDEEELRRLWSKPDTRKALLQELTAKGFGNEQLNAIKQIINAEDSEMFDVLAYIAYALEPLTREERAMQCRTEAFESYDKNLRSFLDFVLGQYVKEGVYELDIDKITGLVKAKYHTIHDAEDRLGDLNDVREAFVGFQQYLYLDDEG